MAKGPTGSGISYEALNKTSSNMYAVTHHAHKRRDARALNLKDVIVRRDGEVVAGKREGHVR